MSAFELKQAAELAEVDDWSSAWEECKKLGLKWGGRGAGGRATNRQTMQPRDVFVEGCTLQYFSRNLLERTTLRLMQGRRYGLIGRNGVGKSTLLRRIGTGSLPGFPQHIRVSQVYQDLPEIEDPELDPVTYLVRCDPSRLEIERDIARLEAVECAEDEIEGQAETLSMLYDTIEEEGTATARAIKVLKNLGFSEARRATRVSEMSGGWKMRCAIALALFQEPDVLLLDEPTNHLDIEGVEWLRSYLLGPGAGLTILMTSHDRNFMDDVCTDIILFRHLHLHYYPGNYSDFEKTKKDKDLSLARSQDLIDKQRKHVEETIQRMQVVAAKSDSKSGMVASRKKKLARVGVEKNAHGHRFRAQQDSWKGISSGIREGSMLETALGGKTGESRSIVDGPDKEEKMKLPNPPPLGTFGPLFSMRSVFAGYRLSAEAAARARAAAAPAPAQAAPAAPVKSSGGKDTWKRGKGTGAAAGRPAVVEENESNCPSDVKMILKNVSLDIEQNSKIAILGKNGCGKSTLMTLLMEASAGTTTPDLMSMSATTTVTLTHGEVSRMSGFRIAHYQQNLADKLPFDQSALEYMMAVSGVESSEQLTRAHLGSFGLGGDLVLRQIGTLSGGQKSRIVLAELTINKPNLLVLDEPTNNLDLEAVRALGEAVKEYTGAVLMASHDCAFVSETCEIVYYLFKGVLTRLEGGVDEYKAIISESVERQRKTLLAS